MAPLPPDPYKILGVAKDAPATEIRSSYRKLVLKCHPDKVQDPQLKEEKQTEFQRVQQAYEMLNDEAERQKYDDKVREHERQLKAKAASMSSPKHSAKYSGEFEIRTPDMRSSAFKASPSTAKVYTFSSRYDDEYGTRSTRIFETKSSRSTKRDPSYSERHSKREAEKEREKDKDRERRRKEEKEAQKQEKKRQEKQRDRELKREAEEKYRSRNAKPYIEVVEDDVPTKSDRKRSSKKHDDKAGRSSRGEDKPISSSRPPVSNSFYSPNDRSTYESASFYVQQSRGAPGLTRSSSYSARPAYPPAAPSPPPTNAKKTYATEESDSDDYVRRSSAHPRRGSGDGPRLSRERSAYRRPSHEVLEDEIHVASSPAARHMPSFSRSVPMGSSPPRHDMPLPRVNSMPQPSFARPGPGITRAHTFATSDMPRGRDRSRNQPQAHLESSESDDEYEREREREREHRYRSRRTASPEAIPQVFRYEMDSTRRTRRMPPPPMDMDGGHGHGHGHYMYGQPVPMRVSESRGAPAYRETGHPVPMPMPMSMPPSGRYPNVKTTKYGDVRYSEYPPYGGAVRA